MLYYLFDFLNDTYDLSGAGVFQYISFRASMALIFSLIVSIPAKRKATSGIPITRTTIPRRMFGKRFEDSPYAAFLLHFSDIGSKKCWALYFSPAHFCAVVRVGRSSAYADV